MLIPSGREIEAANSSGDASQVAGVGFLADYGSAIASVWFAVAFGCLVATLLYRNAGRRSRPRSLLATSLVASPLVTLPKLLRSLLSRVRSALGQA
jgi:hypothetical protein